MCAPSYQPIPSPLSTAHFSLSLPSLLIYFLFPYILFLFCPIRYSFSHCSSSYCSFHPITSLITSLQFSLPSVVPFPTSALSSFRLSSYNTEPSAFLSQPSFLFLYLFLPSTLCPQSSFLQFFSSALLPVCLSSPQPSNRSALQPLSPPAPLSSLISVFLLLVFYSP